MGHGSRRYTRTPESRILERKIRYNMEKLLVRINELSNKAKTQELKAEELAEQKELREQYLKLFRAGLRGQLERTKIKELDGTITPLKRKKKKLN